METTSKDAVEAALQHLTTPTAKPPLAIDAEAWDWQWLLVGNETAAERAILDQMITEAKAFLTAIITDQEPRWLSFTGRPGCGKTHLAERIRWFLHQHGARIYERLVRPKIDPEQSNYRAAYAYAQEGAILTKWGTVLDRARGGNFSLFNKACQDHFKIIDDLGVDSFDRDGMATPFAVQKMAELLDRRLRKWTVVTTNFSRKILGDQFDPRISSRLMRGENVIVDCSGLRDYDLRRELFAKERKAA